MLSEIFLRERFEKGREQGLQTTRRSLGTSIRRRGRTGQFILNVPPDNIRGAIHRHHLLACFAHPDDETLLVGGVLAAHAGSPQQH
jgi:hypothetical protein